jgi:hypothetical protein
MGIDFFHHSIILDAISNFGESNLVVGQLLAVLVWQLFASVSTHLFLLQLNITIS